MKILGNIDIANNDHYHRDNTVTNSDTWDLVKNSNLTKSFYYKQENKLFMLFEYDVIEYKYLVFDVENQLFYTEKCILNYYALNYPNVLVHDDQYYGLIEYKRKVNGKKRYDLWNELRALKFKKPGLLVRTEEKWKINKRKFPQKACRHSRRLRSAIFVDNVKKR